MKHIFSVVFLFAALLFPAPNFSQVPNATCSELFRTNCTSCQQTLFNLASDNKCDTLSQFSSQLFKAAFNGSTSVNGAPPFNHPPISLSDANVVSGFNNFCSASNDCPDATAVASYQAIQSNCSSELGGTDLRFRDQVLEVFRTFYFSVADRKALCKTNSTGGYCAIEIINNSTSFLQSSTNSSKVDIQLSQILPPTGYFLYPNNNFGISNISVPDSILCSNCYTGLSNIYINWTSLYPLSGNLQNMTQGVDNLKTLITNKCGANAVVSNLTTNNDSTSSNNSTSISSGKFEVNGYSLSFSLVTISLVLLL